MAAKRDSERDNAVVAKRSKTTDADENEPSLSPFAAFSSPNSKAAAFSAPLTGATNVAALAPLQPVGAASVHTHTFVKRLER